MYIWISEILSQTYGVPEESAVQSCKHFLREFRKCPQHPSTDLHIWRQKLWYQALYPNYQKYCDSVYKQWLQLRYHFLQISHETFDLLKKLKKSYLIGLITNGPSTSQWEKIEKLSLKPLFDVILVSGDLPWEKPNEKIFKMACDYLGIRTENALMVGDKLETDILGGIKAKLGGTVWVPVQSNDKANKSELQPDFIIDHVNDLPKVLKNGSRSPKLRRKSKELARPYNMKKISKPDLSDCNSNSSDGS
ncbi:N-acylneuraminate-9-phosphatase isoform X2 [Harmonia axyridis]|uniref:N-acylneuraminate-9-phosphatase isoform X2 n=1 Tax=Harmonia axyridis TaxID=115357 RepID=UPI001E276FF0|nr:N-acylneuraminate-9-phosphatase isoform X2 [Harmonia axyridis]